MKSGINNIEEVSFDMPKKDGEPNKIMVIGVGGGGSNAVSHMTTKKFTGLDYVVCNTDAQALRHSPVVNKILLGATLTKGDGAGGDPEVAEEAAKESLAEIEASISDNIRMVFIAAGMGGGTGTGAAPVIAKVCKEKGLLTVGIVTTPFLREGERRNNLAAMGIQNLRKQVDAIIVINNQNLKTVYGHLTISECWQKIDDILCTAAQGMAMVIAKHFRINLDIRDARAVLANSGTALIGIGEAEGEGKEELAVKNALESPLLNDNKIIGATKALVLVLYGNKEPVLDEYDRILEYIQEETRMNNKTDIFEGSGRDETLGDAVKVMVIATGFPISQQYKALDLEEGKRIHTLGDREQVIETELDTTSSFTDITFENDKRKLEEQQVIKQYHLKEDLDDAFSEPFNVKMPNQSGGERTSAEQNTQRKTTVVDDFQVRLAQSPLYSIPVVYEVVSAHNQQVVDDLKVSDITIYETQKEPVSVEPPKVVASLSASQRRQPVQQGQLVIHSLAEDEEFPQAGTSPFEAYMQVENTLLSATAGHTTTQNDVKTNPITAVKSTQRSSDLVQQEFSFEPQNLGVKDESQNPFIPQLRKTADNRRDTFKGFNDKFNKSLRAMQQMNDIPAYQRQNVVLGMGIETPNVSNTTISVDSNGEMQIRTNNSYLHDNVD